MPLPEANSPDSLATLLPEKWLEEHGDCLYGFALTRVRNPEMAEDLVQDTLVAAFRSKDRFEGRSKVRSWLVGILKNKIFDHYRKQGRETSFTDLNFYSDEQSEKFEENFWIHETGPQDWAVHQIAELDKSDFWKAFHGCLSGLPPRVADVFTLREMDDKSTEEICEALQVSPNNLWVMLHRARMALRECLETKWFGDRKKHG